MCGWEGIGMKQAVRSAQHFPAAKVFSLMSEG